MFLLKLSLHFVVYRNVKTMVGLPVVPVKVTGIGCEKPVITYAFLDNGSNSTFCTEDLLNKSGLKGEETSFSLSTLEKQNSKMKCSVVSLVVHNLQEDEFIDLPSVFSTPALPITCDDIPKQEDVKRWSHLDGIYTPKVEAQVGLLTGNDSPKALEPREIKQSSRKGPFAVRTVFGRTINGPLGRGSTRGSHTVNRVKGDIELEEQFKRFCNQEFGDSIAETAMQMSKDDHKVVAIMEQTAVLHRNHYAMVLPWKSSPPLLPNDRVMALHRLMLLKKRFHKDPGLLSKYLQVMDDHLHKGYTEKVPESLLDHSDGMVWYLPITPFCILTSPTRQGLFFTVLLSSEKCR